MGSCQAPQNSNIHLKAQILSLAIKTFRWFHCSGRLTPFIFKRIYTKYPSLNIHNLCLLYQVKTMFHEKVASSAGNSSNNECFP